MDAKIEQPKIEDNQKLEQNKMREIDVEKMILHCGGTEDKLEKSIKLLGMITGSKKIYTVQSKKRFPAFGIAPGKKSGCKITLRDKAKILDLLARFFVAVDNQISRKAISENQFCFGVHEYIEIPGLEYDRDIGILGFEVMLVFKRKGKSVKLKKIKQGKYPKKQEVTKEEILSYLTENFNLEVGK
jgi:large subunit ribosomal protein L5